MAKKRVHELAKKHGMSNKALVTTLKNAGLPVTAHTSSVEEEAVDKLLGENGKVVALDQARKPVSKPKPKKTPTAPSKPGKVGSDEWYALYPHVVKGSVRDATTEDKRTLKAKCHGKVCTIKCVDTGEKRVINTQDAFQVKRTPKAQKLHNAQRRKERRMARRQARKSKKAQQS